MLHVNRAELSQAADRVGLSLDDSILDRYQEFEDRLYEHNRVKNLTRVPQEESWQRHFLDSLLFQDLIPHGASLLDIGTGPGLPAWPLALARPDLQVDALDSNGKMLDFLREQSLPNLRVVQVRAEEWGVRERYDVVTGRAVAPLPAQLELSAAPCKVGGLVIPMRSLRDNPPPLVLRLGLRLRERVERSLGDAEGTIRLFPVYEKVQPTEPRFPRRWAEIKAKPLFAV